MVIGSKMAFMHAIQEIAPTISPTMSWDELCAAYPNEWVCLVEVERAPTREVLAGRVVGHGKTRAEPMQQAQPWLAHYERITRCYTGEYSDIRLGPMLVFDEERSPPISPPLTWAEICALYPDEWVCLVDVEYTQPNGCHVRTGRVVGHGKTSKEPFLQARPWRAHYELITHLYTGKITKLPLRPSVVFDAETGNPIRG